MTSILARDGVWGKNLVCKSYTYRRSQTKMFEVGEASHGCTLGYFRRWFDVVKVSAHAGASFVIGIRPPADRLKSQRVFRV